MSKKIFIDCGANQGQSIENFKKYWMDWNEYEIHSFEANPDLSKYFEKYNDVKNIHFHPYAVWVENGTVNFYIGKHDGSSIKKNKRTGNLSKVPINVKSIDLSDWIKTNFSKNDYIILKMDIEGSEYDVIPHLLENEVFEYINKFYIEFHNNKVNIPYDVDQSLKEKINKYNTEIIADHGKGLNFIVR